MAGEDLSVSVPAEVPPQTSTGPVGVGFSSQNAPVDAPSAPRSPTETSPAAEPRLSPKWTFTELGSALESGSHPEHTQSSPTAAAGDPSGRTSNDYDPGYTDNDALCATCRFLLEDPNLDSSEFEGWEVEFGNDGWGEERLYVCSLNTKMTWSGHLKGSLFDNKCPLCCELLSNIWKDSEIFFQLHPTQEELTVRKALQRGHWGHINLTLVVADFLTLRKDIRVHATTDLFAEDRDELHDNYAKCTGWDCNNSVYQVSLLSDRAIGNPGPFESNTGSDLSWQLVRGWMAKCVSSHQKCNRLQSVAPPLPTRVIDVGSRGGNCPPRLHVVTDKASGHYATLSHRWGSQEMLKLEVNKLEDLKREIPWERLPKTFQDAIQATRRLGIQYIWIDSLCIIQDSPDGKDWAAESAKMTSVYENSYINLAAADAMDSTQGCFFDRNPSSVRPVRLHIDSRYYYASASHRFADNVATAPLYRRGWVYQERTLAPRIIHCCAKQLYWECLESIASESFPRGLPHCIECTNRSYCQCSEWQKITPPASDINKYLDGSSPSSNEYFESLMLWNRVAVQYQTLDLTFERDKLVAISGLAKMHSRFLNTRYLAGVWLEHLPAQLLWYRVWRKDKIPPSYSEYVAPSWSYASIPGPVEPTIWHEWDMPGKEKQFRPIIQILDATVDLVDKNHPFGAVSRGALRIKGPLANSSRIKNFEFHETRQIPLNITCSGSSVGYYSMDTVRYPSQLRCKKPIYFLPVMLDQSYLFGFRRNQVSGLLIQETDCGEYTFRRVGVFGVSAVDEADSIPMLPEVCRSQNGPDDDGPFPEWGKPQTITLI